MESDTRHKCVASKHLFNFKLNGVLDGDIMTNEDRLYGTSGGEKIMELWNKMEELESKDDPQSLKEYVDAYRESSEIEWGQLGKDPTFIEANENCSETYLAVPTTHHGDYDVPVYIYTPKRILENKANPALLFAHGGGAIAFTPEIYKPWLLYLAFHTNVVIFNVEYRLAPETKCPNNAMDFYESVKYVAKNAAAYGVDPERICISGDSGGGYICLAAMILIAQNGDIDMVKLAIPEIPMCSDYCFSDMAAMTKEEKEVAISMRKNWKMISSNFKKQRKEPLLFPDKARHKVLMKVPPTVIITGEFDIFLTETTRMANKLRAAGRLLEFIIFPGVKHGSNWYPKNASFKTRIETFQTIIEEYLK